MDGWTDGRAMTTAGRPRARAPYCGPETAHERAYGAGTGATRARRVGTGRAPPAGDDPYGPKGPPKSVGFTHDPRAAMDADGTEARLVRDFL